MTGAGPSRRVLITVSGTIAPDIQMSIAAGDRPRADFLVLAERIGAEVVDVDRALRQHGRFGRLLLRIAGPGALLGWHCFRRRTEVDVVLTDGEQVGLPLALLSRIFGRGRAAHVMIVHILSVPKKAFLIRGARLASLIDRYVVYASSQREYVATRFGVGRERIVLTPFMVDTEFFDPGTVEVEGRRMICSAGLERRDYATMLDAVEGLDVDVVIAAASPWSKQPDSTKGRAIPSNVVLERLDLAQLRRLYAAARCCVVPLDDVDFQAGITTILEAMSMALPVIVTRTAGQTDTIEDGVTGRYVSIGDVGALRAAIMEVLADPEASAAMGERARAWAVEHASIERYADRLATVVDDVLSRVDRPRAAPT